MQIALIGTGLMGYPMAERLLKSGHSLTVYNRTRRKAQGLKALGARLVQNPREAVQDAQCIILMLTDYRAINEILLIKSSSLLKDHTFIQMGTIAPNESIKLKEKIQNKGGEYLECPVLGSKTEAQTGALILMVGATQEQFNKWYDVLKCFGPAPRFIGAVGKAASLKLALNQLIASLMVSFSLSVAYLQHREVKIEDFMDILRKSALYAPMFDKKLPLMLSGNYRQPNFPVKHLLKDIDLFLNEAKNVGLASEILTAARKIVLKAIKMGLDERDYSAIYKAVNQPS